jgi:integrase/recombinase XerD
LEQAIDKVPGFKALWHDVERAITLGGRSKSTLTSYGRALAKMALHLKSDPLLAPPEQVQEYLFELVKAHGVHSSYYLFAVSSLRYAMRARGIEPKAGELPSVKHKHHLPVVLGKGECRRLFAAPPLLKHRVLLTFIYSAGLRMNEARMMEIRDIDSERMTIRVRQGKGNKDRYVPLGHLMLEGLRKYVRECRPVKYLFNGQKPGEPLGDRSMQWVMVQAVKRSGINKEITLHTLRHSYATHLLEDGVDLVTIKEQLGHAKIETTMLYLHIARVRKTPAHSPLDTLYAKR